MKSISSIIFLLSLSLNVLSQNSYTRDWQQIDSLTNIGQSQTALEMVVHIYDQTKAANQADQFVKASLYRMKLEADFQEDYYEKTIVRTLLEIQPAKSPVKQILQSMVAELYWRYYQNNRWRIMARSKTVNVELKDIKTWDLEKMVSACMENYEASLKDKDLLRSTPLSSYSAILIKQDDSQKYRPTLFDFLAHRAIDFYSSSDAGLTKPANTFLMNDANYFGSTDKFTALDIVSPDSFSFEFKASKLYQEAINLHLKDTDPTPLIDADLERLSYVHQKSTLPEKDSLYLAALHQLENQYKNHASSSEVAYQIAVQINNDNEQVISYSDKSSSNPAIPASQKWNKKQALEICQKAINPFPDSFGAKNCLMLMESIRQATLSVTTGYAVIIGKPVPGSGELQKRF